jgi:hypothetical protein
MSNRSLTYCYTLIGGWSVFLAWVISAITGLFRVESEVLFASLLAGLVGLTASAALGVFDSWLTTSPSQRLARMLTISTLGFLGGIAAGLVSDLLMRISPYLRFLGWMSLGIAMGTAINLYDLLQVKISGKPIGLAGRKLTYGIAGGAAGGCIGGMLFTFLDATGLRDSLPRFSLAVSLVLLGSTLGLLIGVAQSYSKESWIRIESGNQPGRELVLAKVLTTLGRAESCDFGLREDLAIDNVHAHIQRSENSYLIVDAGSEGGTFLNNRRVTQPIKLFPGDFIRVGGSTLMYGERCKEKE